MYIKINSINDVIKYSNRIPFNALADVNSRINDWLASGGRESDPYIKQQFKYLERVLNYKKDK